MRIFDSSQNILNFMKFMNFMNGFMKNFHEKNSWNLTIFHEKMSIFFMKFFMNFFSWNFFVSRFSWKISWNFMKKNSWKIFHEKYFMKFFMKNMKFHKIHEKFYEFHEKFHEFHEFFYEISWNSILTWSEIWNTIKNNGVCSWL